MSRRAAGDADRPGPRAPRWSRSSHASAPRRTSRSSNPTFAALALATLLAAGCGERPGDGYSPAAAGTAAALGGGSDDGDGGGARAGEREAVRRGAVDRGPPIPVDPADRGALARAFGVAPIASRVMAVPPNNRPSPARADLGRLLFFDPILSGERDVSCAVCHIPERAFSDGRPRSVGAGGGAALGPARPVGVSRLTGQPFAESARNAPTVLNAGFLGAGADADAVAPGDAYAGFLSVLFWDGRSEKGLEGQALHPLGARDEMAGDAYPFRDAHWTVLARLRAIPDYERRFRAAFPELADEATAITSSSLARAIAAFERTLVTPDAPFDRWLAGDDGALDAAATRGKALFFGRAGCAACHRGPMLSDFSFAVVGAPQAGPGLPEARGDDIGRAAVTGDDADRYAFRTPPLRNVALTAPYFHAGTAASLAEVVAFFDRGGNDRGLPPSTLDRRLRPLGLPAEERADLVAFLGALTGRPPDVAVPAAVPSGLVPVVGDGAALTGAEARP